MIAASCVSPRSDIWDLLYKACLISRIRRLSPPTSSKSARRWWWWSTLIHRRYFLLKKSSQVWSEQIQYWSTNRAAARSSILGSVSNYTEVIPTCRLDWVYWPHHSEQPCSGLPSSPHTEGCFHVNVMDEDTALKHVGTTTLCIFPK